MRFYDRDAELEVLEKALNQKGAAIVVISGRRRVGKSRLVDEFLGKRGLKILIVPKEEKQVAAELAVLLSDQFKPTLNTVGEALEYFFAKSGERIFYIDEFPNFVEINGAIPYELQRLWEIYKGKTDKVLILSGSYVSMMDKIFTRQNAPLFNRASFKLLLEPLKPRFVWEMQKELGIKDPIRMISNYCILGGIPYYYEVIERYGTSSGVKELFFGVGPLKEEGQDILRQEFGRAYRKYFSVLEAIGSGLVSAGEIANKMGITPTTLSKYIQSLQDDFKLVERRVPFGQNPSRSKKGIYTIKDNLLAFWFSHVYGREQVPTDAEVNAFVSRRFESLCSEFLADLLRKKGERIIRSGHWWGNVKLADATFEQREIDMIVETEKTMYIGECKWGSDEIGRRELEHLKEAVGGIKTAKPIKFILFNKKGFSMKETEECLLFDAEMIVEKG